MATVGKNIHKQWICTIKRKSSGRRIQPYLTLLRHWKAHRECMQEDWQRAAKRAKIMVMSLLFYLSFCVWAELFWFSGVIKHFWLKYLFCGYLLIPLFYWASKQEREKRIRAINFWNVTVSGKIRWVEILN